MTTPRLPPSVPGLNAAAPPATLGNPLASEVQQTLGGIIHVVLAVVVLMFLLVAYLHGDPREMLILGTLTTVCLGMEWFHHKGYVRLLPALVVYTLISCSTAGVILYGSVRSVAIVGFAAALTAAGMFLRRSALIAAATAVCTVLGMLVYGESHQWFGKVRLTVGMDTWLLYSVVFIGFALTVYNSRQVTLRAVEAQTLQLERAEVAEREARISRERLALAYRYNPGAIAVLEGSARVYVEVNEAFERMFGVSREDVIGKTSTELNFWVNAAARHRCMTLLTAQGEVRDFEAQARGHNGRVFDMRLSSARILSSATELVVTEVTDVTAARRREQLLLEMARGFSGEVGEALLKSLVTHLGRAMEADQVLIGEFDQLLTPDAAHVNTLAMVRDAQPVPNVQYGLAGTPCKVTLDSTGFALFDRGVAERFPQDVALANKGYEAYIGTALRDADGTPIGILNALWRTPQTWTAEQHALVRVFASRAASELVRVRRDREIQRLSNGLEQQVQARTTQLEAVNAELESFAYSVSHDLRSPLRAIDGFTRVLAESLEGRLSASEQGLFDRVLRSTRRMNDLINDLLGLAQVNEGHIQIQPVDLSALAEEVVAALRHSQPERQVETDIQPGLTVMCDPHLARIVLDNLLGNAWKYSQNRQQARIALGRKTGTPGRNEPDWLVVRDNGAGFDMAYADKLFKPFHRLHRDQDFEGSGIGLATVHRILERHGGSIHGHGTPGHGAEFQFFFTPPDALA